MNPIRAGIVSKASDFLYSSASNYVLKKGILDVSIPSTPIINPLKSSGYDIDISSW